MRTFLALTLALCAAAGARADSLIAIESGTFDSITFIDAVMRTFSGSIPDQLVVSPSGAIGSALTSGTLHPGSVIQVDFDTPVRNIAVVFEPAQTSSVTCEVEGIEENGNLVNFGAFFSTTPISMQLSPTFLGRVVRTLRIRPNTGVMRLLRVDYSSLRLRPGQMIQVSNLAPGATRDAFITGCDGRSLELTPIAVDTPGSLRISVGPANDPLGEATRSFLAKSGKSKTISIERPEIYRVRIQNLSFSQIPSFEIATADSFTAAYDKTKFEVDPISNLTVADAPFGALPETELDITVKAIGTFSAPIDLDLLEGLAPLAEVDLTNPQAPASDTLSFSEVSIRKGGLLRLRCSNLGDSNNRLKVTVKRSRPFPGIGELSL